jgi:hypothetical protein
MISESLLIMQMKSVTYIKQYLAEIQISRIQILENMKIGSKPVLIHHWIKYQNSTNDIHHSKILRILNHRVRNYFTYVIC